ncbi:TPA: tail fiber assembly protein [Escherichia coli]|nr:tail fiber assembly protein [Escherichia coli]HAX5184819.1 tail fiber assembly protein [Escherichia coli]HAX5231297.1 tail fiber assembly protein [Escherichia coli]
MNNFKNFTPYIPGEDKADLLAAGAGFLQDENGNDWYECQKLFAENTYKIMYDSDNIVRSVTTDVSALYPVNASVAELESLPDGMSINGSWYYHDGEVLPVPVDYQQLAETQRQQLLSDARDMVSDWKTELDLEIISDEDKDRLVLWMTYIKTLKSLDFSQVSDESSFDLIQWPEKPGV